MTDNTRQKRKLSLAVQIFIALVFALVAGIDRIFDMGRTTVSITGDASCVIVVSNLLKKKLASWAKEE